MTKKYTQKIACIGEAMVELAFAVDSSDKARVGFAGDTLNTAIYLKRALGEHGRVSFVSALGDDPLSERMIDFIKSEDVSAACIARIENKLPGLYSISTDDAGERTFSYWRESSAARLLFQANGVISFDFLEEFDMIYYSAITLAILPPEVRAAFFMWLERFRALPGKSVAFDSNYRPRLWGSVNEARDCIAKAWALTDIALPSVDDEQALFEDKSEAAVMNRLRSYGLGYGALKRGGAGPAAISGEEEKSHYATAEKIVDTTAAGDSFNGALLASLVAGESLQTAMQAGHNCALKVIACPGAIIPKT